MISSHTLQMAVRDYECDLQGVVNNAVYQNYLEHARHEFLRTQQLDFAALAQAGVNLVVVRAELDYKSPLTSGDEFIVNTRLEKVSRLKLAFHQTITRVRDQKLIVTAIIIGAGVNKQGRPYMPEELLPLLGRLETGN